MARFADKAQPAVGPVSSCSGLVCRPLRLAEMIESVTLLGMNAELLAGLVKFDGQTVGQDADIRLEFSKRHFV